MLHFQPSLPDEGLGDPRVTEGLVIVIIWLLISGLAGIGAHRTHPPLTPSLASRGGSARTALDEQPLIRPFCLAS